MPQDVYAKITARIVSALREGGGAVASTVERRPGPPA